MRSFVLLAVQRQKTLGIPLVESRPRESCKSRYASRGARASKKFQFLSSSTKNRYPAKWGFCTFQHKGCGAMYVVKLQTYLGRTVKASVGQWYMQACKHITRVARDPCEDAPKEGNLHLPSTDTFAQGHGSRLQAAGLHLLPQHPFRSKLLINDLGFFLAD